MTLLKAMEKQVGREREGAEAGGKVIDNVLVLDRVVHL